MERLARRLHTQTEDEHEASGNCALKPNGMPTTLRAAMRIFPEVKVLTGGLREMLVAVEVEGVLHNRTAFPSDTVDVVFIVDNGYVLEENRHLHIPSIADLPQATMSAKTASSERAMRSVVLFTIYDAGTASPSTRLTVRTMLLRATSLSYTARSDQWVQIQMSCSKTSRPTSVVAVRRLGSQLAPTHP